MVVLVSTVDVRDEGSSTRLEGASVRPLQVK
jgi:hypothetical protein